MVPSIPGVADPCFCIRLLLLLLLLLLLQTSLFMLLQSAARLPAEPLADAPGADGATTCRSLLLL